MKKPLSKHLQGVIALLAMSNVGNAQFVTPTIPDQFIANVTTPSPCHDDLVVNCDMLQTSAGGMPIKAVAWDDRIGSTYLYFEDNAGNAAPIEQFEGLRPDIVLADDKFNPNNYRAAVVYIDGGYYPHINFYLLTGVGTSSFTVTQTGSIPLSPNPVNHNTLGILYDSEGMPHIDMWSDVNNPNPATGLAGMYEYVVTWEEGYNIMYAYGDVSTNSWNGMPIPLPISPQKDQPDVSCYTEVNTGQRVACFVYRTANGLEVTELDMATLAHAGASPYTVTTKKGWIPRIESMSQYNNRIEPAKWEVVCSYGDFPTATAYNAASLGAPQDLGGLTGDDSKSVCVAAGLQFTAGATDLGNKQYTAGIYQWASQNLYAREIDANVGIITNPNYYQINTNPMGAWPSPGEYCLADASKTLALSNCSNTGEYLLSAWYDGHDAGNGTGGAIWMKLSPNTTPMVFKATSLDNIQSGNDLTIYPNPAKDRAYLPKKGTYQVYDMKGQQVLEVTIANDNTIDVSALPIGLYIIRTVEGNSVYRFTKE